MAGWRKKTWKDRKTEYPTRRTLTKTDGSTEIVTVTRNEGQVSQEGDAFSAANLNDLETRIDDGFNEVNGNLKMTDLRFSNSITGKAYADAGITSVLGCAKQYSPYGISYIITGETSTDLPDTTYKYGMGIILKRADDQITILLFSNTGNKIAVNNYYGTKWSGWIPLLS